MEVILSIKPVFAQKILSGEKKYEFRKQIFRKDVKRVLLYASYPVCKVIGEFEVAQILSLDLEDLWLKTMSKSGIDKCYYDDYFYGKKMGHAIAVKKAKKYSEPFDLDSFNFKRPPQSFAYLKQ